MFTSIIYLLLLSLYGCISNFMINFPPKNLGNGFSVYYPLIFCMIPQVKHFSNINLNYFLQTLQDSQIGILMHVEIETNVCDSYIYPGSQKLNNRHPCNSPTLQSANHPNCLQGAWVLVKAVHRHSDNENS